MVQHVCDLELEEILDSEIVKHSAVHSGLEERVFVLWQPDVIQPAHYPLVVQSAGLKIEVERRD